MWTIINGCCFLCNSSWLIHPLPLHYSDLFIKERYCYFFQGQRGPKNILTHSLKLSSKAAFSLKILVQMDVSPFISKLSRLPVRNIPGLCLNARLFSCLEHFYSGSLHNGLITAKSQLEHHILREAFSDYPPIVILPHISLFYWLCGTFWNDLVYFYLGVLLTPWVVIFLRAWTSLHWLPLHSQHSSSWGHQ